MNMDDQNEAGLASEDTGASNEAPVSIRDSLRAALDTVESKTPAADNAGQPRDGQNGRYLPKDQSQAAPASGQQPAAGAAKAAQAPAAASAAPDPQQAAQSPAVTQEQQPTAAAHRAPPGWSPEAKAQFASLPPEVQAAVSKREQEVDNGFRVLQDYKGLEEFTPIVKQAGTTHADVMRKALDWETALQRDPINTVIHVANMAGVNLRALVAGQKDQILQRPPQQQQPQPQPQPRPVNVEAQVEQVLRKRDTQTQVDAFLSDPANVHAEAVIDDMVALINAGRASSLKDAYDTACWMRPDIRQQMISQSAPAPVADPNAQRAAAADQARKASRSISGSSAPGPSQGAPAAQPSSIRDSLKSAMSAARGHV